MDTDEYRQSPITAVRANGQPIRRHLADSDSPNDFPVLAELRSEGATDYVAVPLVFTDPRSTSQPGRRSSRAALRPRNFPISNRSLCR
jgi:adenylate cyclase